MESSDSFDDGESSDSASDGTPSDSASEGPPSDSASEGASPKKKKRNKKNAGGARKRKRSTLGEKLEIVTLVDKGVSRKEISRRFKIGLRIVARMKSEAENMKLAKNKANEKAKSLRFPFCTGVCFCCTAVIHAVNDYTVQSIANFWRWFLKFEFFPR